MTSATEPTTRPARQKLTQPDAKQQVAALCYQGSGRKRHVLLITSRDTGRWVLPKGWPIDGLDGAGSAVQEAWEEAGVRPAKVKSRAIGHFEYLKGLNDGRAVRVEAQVYKIRVADLADSFPEADQRVRKWVTPREASEMVHEPGLRKLLRKL